MAKHLRSALKWVTPNPKQNLNREARHWIENPESFIEIVITVKLTSADVITMSIWRKTFPDYSGPRLRSHHAVATVTETATITRAHPNPIVQINNPSSDSLQDIRLPMTTFIGAPLPPNTTNSIVLDKHILREFGRGLWVPINGYW
ncbi:hypothetical protein N7486_009317 [Penicillium sp. IBT 16267x]|nr:hypothetical protein N7486_009317 [Penicillium sp. IBT 16267x]